jgi:chemotaxis signal transduction protein
MSHPDIAVRARVLAEAFDRSFSVPARVHEVEGRAALAIHVGGDPYLLLLEGLSSVSRSPKIVPLPTGPGSDAQLGIAGIGGALVGVFSLPALLGYDIAPSRLAWLAVSAGRRPVALAFESLDGQTAIPPASIAAAPPGTRRHVAGFVRVADESAARGLLDLGSLLSRLGASAGDAA